MRRYIALILMSALAALLLGSCELTGAGGTGDGDTDDGGGGSGSGDTTVTVTYEAGRSPSGTVPVDSTVYSPGDTVTVVGNTGNLAVSDDLVFDGWVAEVGTEALTLTAGDTFEIGSEDVTLIPNWTTAAGVDPSSDDVEFTFYTEDASDLPMQVDVNQSYLGCITETGPENGVTGGPYNYYSWRYVRYKKGDGSVGARIKVPYLQEGAPLYTPIDLDVDMTGPKWGAIIGGNVEPIGGWPDDCGASTYDLLGTSVTLDQLIIQDGPTDNVATISLVDAMDSLNSFSFGVGVSSSATIAGTYGLAGSRTVEPSSSVLGTVRMTVDNETTAAMNVTESQYDDIYGTTPSTYAYITNGSLEITESNGIYTIVWSFTTGGGETVSGTYEGEIDADLR